MPADDAPPNGAPASGAPASEPAGVALAQARSIAVLRALPGLGDLLCAVPALRSLRRGAPDAHITLVGLPSAGWFVRRFPMLVDDLLPVTSYPALPETQGTAAEAVAFLLRAQARRFDLAVQLHGSGLHTNPLAALLGARTLAGAYLPGELCPDPHRFVPYPPAAHEIHRLAEVVTHLGAPFTGGGLEWPACADDDGPATDPTVARLLEPGAPLVCLHPGSSLPSRRWPGRRYAEIGDHLARRGCRVAVTGVEAEGDLTAAVVAAMSQPAVDLAGRTDLATLARLLGAAALVVCNDTGTSHLAAAVGTPSVVLFTVTDPARWAPLDRNRHRVVTLGRRASGVGEAGEGQGGEGDAEGSSGPEPSDAAMARALRHADDLVGRPGRAGAGRHPSAPVSGKLG